MRNKLTKITLAASIALAMAFIFSCGRHEYDGYYYGETKLSLANGLRFTSPAQIPEGDSVIITTVQFIAADGNSVHGTLIFTSSEELIELYLQIEGENGYYTKVLSSSDIANYSNRSYSYSLDLDFALGLNAKEQVIRVSGKSKQGKISKSKESENSTIKKYDCSTTSISGGVAGFIGSFDMGRDSGSFEFEYNTVSVPDEITIYGNSKARETPIFYYPSGGTGGWKSTTVDFSQRIISVKVVGSAAGTFWEFRVNCHEGISSSSRGNSSSSSSLGNSSSSGGSSSSSSLNSSSSSSTMGSSSSSGGSSSSSSLNSSSSSQQSSVVYGTPVNYGNETYQTVVIGTQTWMARNLNYEPSGTNVATNSKCYDNDPANCAKYGRLYDWATAMALPSSCNSSYCIFQISKYRGICPVGWHIPNTADWNKLISYVDGTSDTLSLNPYHSYTAGRYLKARNGWNSGGNGEDTYGFAALPGGSGNSAGNFYDAGNFSHWWGDWEEYADIAYSRHMEYDSKGVFYDIDYKSNLFSVRCIKD